MRGKWIAARAWRSGDKYRDFLASFIRNDRGNFAVMFALLLVPLLVSVGMAVDFSQALVVRGRLSHAIDAAALAAGSIPDPAPGAREAKVMSYLRANYTPEEIGTVGNITFVEGEKTLEIVGTAKMETAFLGVIGVNELPVKATTEVSMERNGLELVMVLDNTGSMRGSRISSLKRAATSLVDILYGKENVSNSLKIGLVPFSQAVNIGDESDVSGWMDQFGDARIAKAKFDFQPGQTVWDLAARIPNRALKGCVETREPPFDTTDDPPDTGDTKWQPYFAPDEPDKGKYSNSYLKDKVKGNAKKRQKSTKKYNGKGAKGSSRGPSRGCTTQPVTRLSNGKADIKRAIKSMNAEGYTHIPVGLAWGWRLISPGEPFTEGVSYHDQKWRKAMVLLTDGENTIQRASNDNKSQYTAYGYLADGRLGTTNSGAFVDNLNDNTQTLCTNIKTRGIRVYTITFAVRSSTVRNLMKACASDPSLYFDSPSDSDLQNAFKAIATDLENLRVSR